MSPLLLKLFEALAWLRIPFPSWRRKVAVGKPDALDESNEYQWRNYLTAEKLYKLWGPHQQSVWRPFHCVTLFAALDAIPKEQCGPNPGLVSLSFNPKAEPPAWCTPETLTIVDLPGPLAIQVTAWLCRVAKAQPICTFDNWPHPRGLLKPEATLAALLYYSPNVAATVEQREPNSPAIWVCDSQRLGTRIGRPKEFDNRYFLDDSLLPGPAFLSAQGIRKIVYVVEDPNSCVIRDITDYLRSLRAAGLIVQRAEVRATVNGVNGQLVSRDIKSEDNAAGECLHHTSRLIIEDTKQLYRGTFFRSSAGGFGAPIPEPSSSSG